MLVATDYMVLRGLVSTGRVKVPLDRKPLRVATLLDEPMFLATGCQMKHHYTVFLEDQHHDWDWKDGMLRYFSRCGGPEDQLDVLIVYAMEDRKFCVLCQGCPAKPQTNLPSKGHRVMAHFILTTNLRKNVLVQADSAAQAVIDVTTEDLSEVGIHVRPATEEEVPAIHIATGSFWPKRESHAPA